MSGLSGFELYSHWVPLKLYAYNASLENSKFIVLHAITLFFLRIQRSKHGSLELTWNSRKFIFINEKYQ